MRDTPEAEAEHSTCPLEPIVTESGHELSHVEMVALGSESARITYASDAKDAEGVCEGVGDTPGGRASVSTTICGDRRNPAGSARYRKGSALILTLKTIFPASGVGAAVEPAVWFPGAGVIEELPGPKVELSRNSALPCMVGDAKRGAGDLDEVDEGVGGADGCGEGGGETADDRFEPMISRAVTPRSAACRVAMLKGGFKQQVMKIL